MRKLAIVLAAIIGTAPAANMQTANQVEIVFGAYAVVVTGGHTMDIATIKRPYFGSEYEPHPLQLSIVAGTLDLAKTTVAPQHLPNGHGLGWDLKGLTVEVLNDGNPLPNEPIELPKYKDVPTCEATVPAEQINNRFFIPDLTRIANQQNVATDIESRLDGRLRVHGGTLKVTELVPGCFEFKKDGTTVRKQRIANGRRGLTYTHSFGQRVMLRLTRNDKPLGDVAFAPEGGRVRLAIFPRQMGESMAGRPIRHFKYFYSLLRNPVSDDDREIPTWLGGSDRPTSPGEACPPGFYEVP